MATPLKPELFGIVEGDSQPFQVDYVPNESVGALKVKIKEAKKNDLDYLDADKLVLWKADIPTVRGADYNRDYQRSVDNIKSDSSNMMDPVDLVQEYIQEALPKTIQIIVEKPSGSSATTSGSIDWRDPSAIRTWIRQYERPTGTNKHRLVSAFGSRFPLCSREDTIDMLWDGTDIRKGVLERFNNRYNGERHLHPIPFLACGPGTGKSRFLQEVGGLLQKKADSCNDETVKTSFSNMIAINISYGNGTLASEADIRIGSEASIGVRLLYEHFINTESTERKIDFADFRQIEGIEMLEINTALRVIRSDLSVNNTSTSQSVFVIGIDELNQLYDLDPTTLKKVIQAAGALSCSSGNPFYIPILAGTIQGPIENMVKLSTFQLLQLPLPLLSDKDTISIGRSLHFEKNNKVIRFTKDYLEDDMLFRLSISDVGGMARAVELFYHYFTTEMTKRQNIPEQDKQLTDFLSDIDIITVMRVLVFDLKSRYPFQAYVELMTPVLARSILDITVSMDDHIGENRMTYKDLRMTGLINLEYAGIIDTYHIRVPYLWLTIFIKEFRAYYSSSSTPFAFWTDFIDPNQEVSWAGWEKFNMNYLALRLCLFSYLKMTTVSLQELFSGADFSCNTPDFQVKVPDYRHIKVHQLLEKFPLHKTPEDMKNHKHTNILDDYSGLFINGKVAPTDGFMQLQTQDSDTTTLFLSCQMKWAEELDSKMLSVIDQKLISKEYPNLTTILKSVKKQDSECIFGFFSNRQKSSGLKIADQEEEGGEEEESSFKMFIIHRGNFKKYYGHTFSGRAQFSVSSRLFVNSAPEHHIRHIPGVGEKIAQAIINQRKRKRLEDLDDFKTRVPRFPKKEYESIRF
ncbi:hypothetical protein BGZ49_002313 [Haplosporangium sp. Z 27]|nr:hypothetical protein BGZ49_002313 [Haplosporangium sp. Z 27]